MRFIFPLLPFLFSLLFAEDTLKITSLPQYLHLLGKHQNANSDDRFPKLFSCVSPSAKVYGNYNVFGVAQFDELTIKRKNEDTLVIPKSEPIPGIRTIPNNIRNPSAPFSTTPPGTQWGNPLAVPLSDTYPVTLPPLNESKDQGKIFFYSVPIPVSWIQALDFDIQAIPGTDAALQRFSFKTSPVAVNRITDTLKYYTALYHWGDAGFYRLCSRMAAIAYPNHSDHANLLTAAVLQNAGYRVETVWQNQKPVLLISSQQELFDIPALNDHQASIKKYLWNPSPQHKISSEPILIAENKEVDKLKPFNLQDIKIPRFKGPTIERSIVFNDPVTRSSDTFSVTLSIAVLHFMGDYPQMEQKVYFSRELSSEVLQSLIPQLSERMQGMRTYEALSWLLRFVQYSFPYVTDEKQFGKEKVMFAEEALFYGYTDCEDRSVLFAALVSELLKRPVVGIHFPGHVATAVLTSKKEARGAQVKYMGNTYMICDPSYKHGMPGALAPELQKYKPRIIGN
jgi:hypothetical protein